MNNCLCLNFFQINILMKPPLRRWVGFIFIALQFNPTTGEVGKALQDICTIQEFTGEENWDDDWDPDVAGGIDCAARSLCIAVRTVAKVCCVCGCIFTDVRRYAHARTHTLTHTHTHTQDIEQKSYAIGIPVSRAMDAEHLSFNTSLTSQQTDAAAFAFMLLWRHVS